jgi:flavorubredoxin
MGVQGGHHVSEIGKTNLHNDKKRKLLFGKDVFGSFPPLNELSDIDVNHHLKQYELIVMANSEEN